MTLRALLEAIGGEAENLDDPVYVRTPDGDFEVFHPYSDVRSLDDSAEDLDAPRVFILPLMAFATLTSMVKREFDTKDQFKATDTEETNVLG